jgi:hypothetical protein
MNNEYEKIDKFTSQLRSIKGLYLFRIFSKYTSLRDINRLFNFLAQKEKEDDLRQLEELWGCFIETGSIQRVCDDGDTEIETD